MRQSGQARAHAPRYTHSEAARALISRIASSTRRSRGIEPGIRRARVCSSTRGHQLAGGAGTRRPARRQGRRLAGLGPIRARVRRPRRRAGRERLEMPPLVVDARRGAAADARAGAGGRRSWRRRLRRLLSALLVEQTAAASGARRCARRRRRRGRRARRLVDRRAERERAHAEVDGGGRRGPPPQHERVAPLPGRGGGEVLAPTRPGRRALRVEIAARAISSLSLTGRMSGIAKCSATEKDCWRVLCGREELRREALSPVRGRNRASSALNSSTVSQLARAVSVGEFPLGYSTVA